jgi:LCP family protein required for cell wall assembly
MTDSGHDAPGGQRGPDEPLNTPPRRIEPTPDSVPGHLPGPRPGLYPTGPGPTWPGSPGQAAREPGQSSSGPARPTPSGVIDPAAPPLLAGAAPQAPAGPGGAQGPAGGKARHTGARRRTGPAPAQQQLMARISASRKARLHRALLVACGALSALVLLAAGSAWAVTSWINGNIGRVNAGTAGTPGSGPLNIVVAGIDVRSGLTPQQQLILHVGHDVSSNSDTLMVVHVSADHRHVQVVSIPRDSWVNIPGHGMNKINAAFGLGGPALMVKTVAQDTGLTINDYIEVNFLGFVKVIDALGGVNICLPYAVDDSYSGLRMSAGMHHVDGITALEFARDRHSFATSDLARIEDQQQLLSTMFREAIGSGTLANPVKFTSFLSAATSAVTVDQNLNVAKLADELRGISMNEVTFATVPIGNYNYTTPTGQSALQWNATAAGALFAQLKNDQAPVKTAPARRGLSRSQVSLDIWNGTMIGGLSAGTGTQLAGLGFRVHGSGLTWSSQDITQTLIEYPAGKEAAARLVQRVMSGATLRQVRNLKRIRILLGSAGYQVNAGTPATASPTGGGAPQRTAAQAACK